MANLSPPQSTCYAQSHCITPSPSVYHVSLYPGDPAPCQCINPAKRGTPICPSLGLPHPVSPFSSLDFTHIWFTLSSQQPQRLQGIPSINRSCPSKGDSASTNELANQKPDRHQRPVTESQLQTQSKTGSSLLQEREANCSRHPNQFNLMRKERSESNISI